uniref:Peptidase S1 domain-containing protein n=1 Tax=Panagrolaimus sp. JU765 TaxID=591449 RepID=A0AC34PWK7_9BILA
MFPSILIVAIVVPLLADAGSNCGISPSIQKYEDALNGTDDSLASLKIIYGHESVNGDWPWLVKISSEYDCTGTIIGDKWILTAAHCMFKTGDLIEVFYGDVNYQKAQIVNATNSFPFCPSCKIDLANADTGKDIDIALLELEEPLTFDESIKPICLTRNLDSGPGDYEVAAGWGVDPFTYQGRIVAREDKIPVNSPDYCRYESEPPLTGAKEVCAGTDDLGTSPGDSGGPLMTLKNGKWYQHGVTSRGYGVVLPETFFHRAVYTDVTKFCDWIEETAKNEVQCENDNVFE